MTFDGSVSSGTATFSAGSAKFGSAGVSGAAFNVNGVDSFLSSSPSTATGRYTTGTVEGWVKSANPGAVRVLFGHDGWYWVGCDASGNATARFGDSSADPSVEVSLTSTTKIADGAWHHVAIVFVAGSSVSLYVDGARVATSTANPTLAADKGTRIGSLVANTYAWTTAAIDEVRYSNTARYTGTSYVVPAAAFTPDSNTYAVYHFDGDATGVGFLALNIKPNDANLAYSPGNWDVTAARAKTINAGAYFRALVNGGPSAIVLQFDLVGIATPLPQVTITVDGRASTTVQIASTITVPLPTDTPGTKRLVTVVVKSMTETATRWATQSTAVQFLGISTTPTSCAADPVQLRKLNVLVFGDSITEGVRTLNATATNDTDRNDATVGWAYHLGEKLGAEVGVIGFGGTGITKASGSGGVPSLRNSLGVLWGGGPARSFTGPVPDVIVVELGTNDGTADTTADMIAALNALLAATPASTRILVLRPFNGTNQAGFLAAAVAACAAPFRVTYVDTAGWWATSDSSDNLHPYGYADVTSIAPRVAEAIRGVFNQTASYVNVGGAAKPITPSRI